MGSTKRTLLVTALLAVVVLGGCQTGPETTVPEETPTADELRQQALSAMQDVETASFTMDMSVDSAMGTVEMNADGTMDRAAKRMQMNFDMNVGSQNVKATQYVDGETMYIKVRDQWQTRDMSGQNLWQNNQLAQQQKALESADIRLNGTTTVDNRHVYRLEVEVNETVARELIQQSATQGVGSMENVEINDLQFTQYVDVESNHVRKVDMTMEMTAQGEQATVTGTMTFSNFNEDVSIQIPDAAKN